MELHPVKTLLERQSGVVARRQLIDGGVDDNDIRRWVRRRELARVHTGVYVNHTGPLTWSSRAWAAVLFHWPAALAHDSVINRAGDVIHVAIDQSRTASRLVRVRVHRLARFEERVQWNLGPPRVRVEDALLSRCADAATRVDALAVLADGCRRRITTPTRLAAELCRHPTVARRGWLIEVLDEAAEGVQSLLESGYRRRVERAHGLPRPDRQRTERTEDGVVHRDVAYERFRLVVELDGRIGHELSHDRWDDQDRDLLVAGDEVMTLRLGWRHCETTPCRTAGRLARVLRTRGWRGRPHRCGPSCQLQMAEVRGVSGTG